MKFKLLSTCAFVALAFSVFGQQFNQLQKLVNSDRFQYDQFGLSSLVIGTTLFVGTPYEDNIGLQSDDGSVYIFKSINGYWTEHQKIYASDRMKNAYFGSHLEHDNGVLYVGAYGWTDEASPFTNPANRKGHIYTFEEDASGNWIQTAIITSSDSNARIGFGSTFKKIGEHLIVGTSRHDEVFVMEKDANGNWLETQTLSDSIDYGQQTFYPFGYSIAVENDLLIIGASKQAAHLYQQDNLSGKWVEIQRLTVSDPGAYFSRSMDISNESILIGDYNASISIGGSLTQDVGAAYLFTKDINNIWTNTYTFTSLNPGRNKQFGKQIKLTDHYAVISEYKSSFQLNPTAAENEGAVHLFKRNSSTYWQHIQTIKPADPQSHSLFGSSISLDGAKLYIGCGFNSTDANDTNYKPAAGALYVFDSNFLIGVDESIEDHSISMYPNPNFGKFILDFGIDPIKEASVQIFSTQGQLVHRVDNLNLSQTEFDLSHFQKGLYILKVFTQMKLMSSHKFIVN